MHIHNLYKAQDILMFKECYCSEKAHGTSANVKYHGEGNNKHLTFAPGGGSREEFLKIFDQEQLLAKCIELFGDGDVTLYGEHFGGKINKMRETYGDIHRFVLFDIKIGHCWLSFDDVESYGERLGLEVIPCVKIPTTMEAIDAQRDATSELGERVGIHGKIREGVVLRPIKEVRMNNGQRIIAKHKRDEFMETHTPRKVDAEKLKILEDAREIAFEWVTPMRLQHVLQSFPEPHDMKVTGSVIKTMIDDIEREATDEIVMSSEAKKAIGKRTAHLFKEHLASSLYKE